MRKTFLQVGILFAFFGVILGAFGAHTLKEHISADYLSTFETGVRYQFYHAFALLFLSVLLYKRKTKLMMYAGWFFIVGTALFSGSIYLLATQEITKLSASILGPITPLGGLLLIVGWLLLFISTFQDNVYKRG